MRRVNRDTGILSKWFYDLQIMSSSGSLCLVWDSLEDVPLATEIEGACNFEGRCSEKSHFFHTSPKNQKRQKLVTGI